MTRNLVLKAGTKVVRETIDHVKSPRIVDQITEVLVHQATATGTIIKAVALKAETTVLGKTTIANRAPQERTIIKISSRIAAQAEINPRGNL
jgi:copper(I)-binding protein